MINEMSMFLMIALILKEQTVDWKYVYYFLHSHTHNRKNEQIIKLSKKENNQSCFNAKNSAKYFEECFHKYNNTNEYRINPN